MKIETCCIKLLGPLLFVAMNASCLPFLPAYINVKILGNNRKYLSLQHRYSS